MEYYYEMNLADFMAHQEEVFLSNRHPSLIDSVQRWEGAVRWLLIAVVAGVTLVFLNIFMTLVTSVVAIIIYIFFKRKSTIYFRRYVKDKAKKDLLATYLDNDDQTTIEYTLKLFSDKLELQSTFQKKEILRDELVLRKITDEFIFCYTNKHDAFYIPLSKLSYGKTEVVDWFS